MDARRWLKGKPGFFNPVRGRVTLLAISLTVAVASHGSSQQVSSSLRDSAMTAARVILANDSTSLMDKALAAKVLGFTELSKRYERAWTARYMGIRRLQRLLEAIGAADVGIEGTTAYDLINSPDGVVAFNEFYEDDLLELERRNPSMAKGLQLALPSFQALPFPELSSLIGASVIAQDDQFLGIVADCLNSQSICNEIGRYGSSISRTSIHNSISKYGGLISRLSAYNSLASSPPKIVRGDRTLAYLTKNITKSPAVDPDDLIQWLKHGPTPGVERFSWLENLLAPGGKTLPAELGFSLRDVERGCEVYKYSEHYGELECRSNLRILERKCEVYFADGASGEIDCSASELRAVEARCSVYMYSDTYGDIDCT